ncbi:hypothetical protein MPSEU_000793900 [Mayamaea pseudoterrestris]|nr:hypothetical protein MPSEU_000793900 [Mayamaea pseudoterrestris]
MIEYHGGPFLGFSQQKQEDCIMPDGTDLRGHTSVETRLRRALHKLVPSHDEDFQLQVSSRTDRGVHALGNTLHVDLPSGIVTPKQLLHGWQYHLMRDEFYHYTAPHSPIAARAQRIKNASLYKQGDDYIRAGPGKDINILNAVQATLRMQNGRTEEEEDWNARFSATERLYVYRILQPSSQNHVSIGIPFEYDRSWLLKPSRNQRVLDLQAMQWAAAALVGEHDFSSFRAKGCQQTSPVIQLRDISVYSQPYGLPFVQGSNGGLLGLGASQGAQLITIAVRANSFLYRMVRNLVGYLVHVGQHDDTTQMQVEERTRQLLGARDRNLAPSMAPAQGLFLVHVKHGEFEF